jgi:putative flippase GtrA
MKIFRHSKVRTHFHQLWKFCIAGGLGASIDLGGLTLLHGVVHFPVPLAYITSTLCSVAVVFFINKHFTFANKEQEVGMQLGKFALVYGGAIILNFLLSTGFYSVGVQYILAKALAIGIGAVLNYLLSHHFVFKKKEEEPVVIV